MKLIKRLFIFLSIIIFCVGCDQATKLFAAQYLPRYEIQSYLYDIFRIGYAENTGGFLSFGGTLPAEVRYWIFTIFTGALLFGLLIYLIIGHKQRTLSFVAYTLVFAGGISNLYDRATNNGVVIDFLNIGLGPLRTGIFNVADMAIMAGLMIILFLQFRISTQKQ
jgi:signal peptidase II